MTNQLNLQEIDQEQAINLSKFFITTQQNLLLLGRRGTGKTTIAIQAAQACNYKINYINLSVIERPDLAGYPNIHAAGDIITFKSPYFLPTLVNNKKPDSIILFDEIDKAAPEVTAPLLEILQFKKINGKPLNVAACILTGNLAGENAYSNQISSALLDRTAKYILSFNFNQWIDWAKTNQVHDLILGFLRNNPEFACGKTEDTCYASPSPRGWTLASDALIQARDLKIVDIDTITHIVSGFVGSEAGLRFRMWYEYYRRFEPFVHSLIETGNMTLKFNELMPTEQIVFVISACYFAKRKVFQDALKTKDKFVCLENLCNFFNTYNVSKEIQTMGLYNSFDFDLIGNAKYKIYKCQPFFDLFKKLNENITFKK